MIHFCISTFIRTFIQKFIQTFTQHIQLFELSKSIVRLGHDMFEKCLPGKLNTPIYHIPEDNFGIVEGWRFDSLCNFSIVGCQWTVSCLLGSVSYPTSKHSSYLTSKHLYHLDRTYIIVYVCHKYVTFDRLLSWIFIPFVPSPSFPFQPFLFLPSLSQLFP